MYRSIRSACAALALTTCVSACAAPHTCPGRVAALLPTLTLGARTDTSLGDRARLERHDTRLDRAPGWSVRADWDLASLTRAWARACPGGAS